MPNEAVAEYVMDQGVWKKIFGADITPPPPDPVATPPTYVAAGASNSTAGGATVQWPAGHQINDIGILIVETANEALTLTTANGFVEVPGSPQGTGTAASTTATRLCVYWCRATSTTMAGPVLADPGDHLTAQIHTFRGCPTTGNPWSGTPVGGTAASSTSVSITGYTVTTGDDQTLVCQFCAYATDTVTPQSSGYSNGNLSSLTLRRDQVTGSGNGGGWFFTTGILATAGATGALTATLATAAVQGKLTLALKGTPGTGPPPPVGTGDFRTMVGAVGIPKASWGTTVVPDTTFSDSNGASYVGAGGYVAAARAAGIVFLCKVTGGSSDTVQVDPPADTHFSPTKWKANFLTFKNAVEGVSGGLTEMKNAVKDGVVRGIYTVDDFISPSTGGNGFAAAVTYEQLEDICAYAKGLWPWMPLAARGVNTYLKTTATKNGVVRKYAYLDAGWAQFRPSADGGSTYSTVATRAVAYYAANVQAGIDCGLGCVGGMNMLDRGTGQDPAWGCRVASTANRCGASPNEIAQVSNAALANTGVAGWVVYAYTASLGHTYFDDSSIQTALSSVASAAVGRTDPSINIRGDLQAIP